MGDGKTRITDVDLSLSLGFGMPGSAIGVQSEWRYHTPELPRDLITLPLNDFSPVTTQGWRWIACELMVDSPDENKHWILRVTKATDVWSFAMTIIEVRICSYSAPLVLSSQYYIYCRSLQVACHFRTSKTTPASLYLSHQVVDLCESFARILITLFGTC